MDKQKTKITVIALGIWFYLAILLALLQSYLMFGKISLFILLLIAITLIYKKTTKIIYPKIISQSKTTKIILYIASLIHFIPLFMQLIGKSPPGPDNVVAALIGLLIYSMIQKSEIKREEQKIKKIIST